MKRLSILCAMLAIGSLFLGGVIATSDCRANQVDHDPFYNLEVLTPPSEQYDGNVIQIEYTYNKHDGNKWNSTVVSRGLVRIECYDGSVGDFVYESSGPTNSNGVVEFRLAGDNCSISAPHVSAKRLPVKEDPNKYTIEEAVLETSAPEEEEPPEMEEEEPKDLINSTREQLESNETWNGVAGYIISLMLF